MIVAIEATLETYIAMRDNKSAYKTVDSNTSSNLFVNS
jgi:hypothetical protein